MTDFVGWLPMPEGGEHEAALTADHNAEMIEHVDRFRRVRDRSIFVGDPDDIVPDRVRPRPAADPRVDGASTTTSPATSPASTRGRGDRAALRAALGYAADEPVCVVTVGGSGVGGDLLRQGRSPRSRAPARRSPGLRMLVVAGPRIDPARLPAADGLEVRGYVPDLHRHLAAADLAVVQGGLTTRWSWSRPAAVPLLPAAPPLRAAAHVRHRLDRYGAGRCLDHAALDPELRARAGDRRRTPVDYAPTAMDGAERPRRCWPTCADRSGARRRAPA